MRTVTLYIAMSLDGYIADRDGGVDWLAGQDSGVESDYGYSAFEAGVDTVVMGWNTYHQLVTQLSPGRWIYDRLHSYVITHRALPPAEGITFTAESPCALIRRLREEAGRGVWICGGAGIVRPLVAEDLIDVYHISVIPTILGEGIPLFAPQERTIPLHLERTESSNGITGLIYRRRQPPAATARTGTPPRR